MNHDGHVLSLLPYVTCGYAGVRVVWGGGGGGGGGGMWGAEVGEGEGKRGDLPK